MGSRLRYVLSALVAVPTFAWADDPVAPSPAPPQAPAPPSTQAPAPPSTPPADANTGAPAWPAPATWTVTRTPSTKEKSPPKDPGGNAPASAQEDYSKQKAIFDAWTDTATRTDAVAQRELAVVAACVTAPVVGAKVKLTIDVDAKVHKVAVDKAVPSDVAACFEKAYKDVVLPTFTFEKDKADIVLDWTVSLTPASPAPAAIDRDAGAGQALFGAPSADLGSTSTLRSDSYHKELIREQDQEIRWMGVPVLSARYGVDHDDTFVFFIVQVDGDTSAYALRAALRSRYGQPKWDPTGKAWYWRSAHELVVTQDLGGDSPGLVVSVLDIERTRAAGILGRVPGDPETKTGPRLPSIFAN